ncbi:glycoside hydrolase family 61 protein [Exidia glandulosa HHB12029]|uniref:AA9 family lytic polysaccharide monooxygenase n=1 Tax=Exidia glandulosa HHB12029 TaxID=1314781 RepID=A0A165LBK9_EXIGL|nr:glycoside hydrolase family 61 protein [Exidia glandulosa HHB12029]
MKFAPVVAFAALAQSASAHYIWTTLLAGSTTSTAAVRQPLNNSPVTSPTSSDFTCNVIGTPATQTVNVTAGSTVGFKLDNTIYHLGPAAIYLGKAPSGTTAAAWNGSGASWIKIAEWGATYPQGTSGAMSFADYNLGQLTTTLPRTVPNGDYLLRIEQIGLHVVGAPQWYISCAQITVTGGGSASPTKVSMPPYSASDPGLTVSIYANPAPSPYVVPGPRPFTG